MSKNDVLWDIGCSFDWISPLLQFLGDAAGLVSVEGSAAEIKKLQAKGIRCHNPMCIVGTGGNGYLWQISKSDLKRAQKVLGGRE